MACLLSSFPCCQDPLYEWKLTAEDLGDLHECVDIVLRFVQAGLTIIILLFYTVSFDL